MSFPIHFDDDNAQLPPDQVKIELLEITPYPDRFRIFIHVKVTPFQERPNLVLTLHDNADQIVTELNIIETMHHDMEFTMHIRNRTEPAGVYTLTAELFYETRNPPQDRMIESFVIPDLEVGDASP
jgi:hypothetical protein